MIENENNESKQSEQPKHPNNLRKYREEWQIRQAQSKGLKPTIGELCVRADVSYSYWMALEQGRTEPSNRIKRAIATALGLNEKHAGKIFPMEVKTNDE